MNNVKLVQMLTAIWRSMDQDDIPFTLPPSFATEQEIAEFLEVRD